MKGMLYALLLGMVLLPSLRAAEVTGTLPSGLRVSADYRPARPEAPSLLVLHGFLVTGGFPTVQALVNEFSAKGYAVLAPTLSLGITGRRAGLACDAIHAHTLKDDLAEIGFWVDWLARRTKGPIVLVGHSFGSVQLLDYAGAAPHPRVKGVIGMSMSHVGARGEELRPDDLARAEDRLRAGDRALDRYSLIYCHGNYVASPESYLSYASLDRAGVLERLGRVGLPTIAIMGGEDQRFGADWVASMRQAGVSTRVVDGASHFFDGTHEFDLLDAVDGALRELRVLP
ncbi:MAG: alpha/beta fold hydrolase [Pseudomonadota bacterium]